MNPNEMTPEDRQTFYVFGVGETFRELAAAYVKALDTPTQTRREERQAQHNVDAAIRAILRFAEDVAAADTDPQREKADSRAALQVLANAQLLIESSQTREEGR